MSPEFWQTLQGIWPPLAVAVPLLLVGRWRWSRRGSSAGGAWSASLAVGLGFFVAFWALKHLPLPPRDAAAWLAVLVGGAGVIGVFASIHAVPKWVGGSLAMALLAVAPAIMLSRLWNGWEGAEGYLHVGISTAIVVALGAVLVPLGQRSAGVALPLALTMVAAVGGYLLFTVGSSALLGQLSGALAVGFGCCTVLALWQPGFSIGGGGALVAALGIAGLTVLGYELAYRPGPVVPRLLLLLAPAAAWIEQVPALRARSGLVRAAAVASCAAVPLAAAAWVAQGEVDDYPY